MELMHYAASPVVFDRARSYEQPRVSTFKKPNGFWVSVLGDDDWPTWCRENEFTWGSFECSHRVELDWSANILQITTPEGIDSFHDRYATETDYERRNRDVYRSDSWPVDWQGVARDYDGIVIAPYQWSRRLRPDWYYGWDCASGCVWSARAVLAVEQVDVTSSTMDRE